MAQPLSLPPGTPASNKLVPVLVAVGVVIVGIVLWQIEKHLPSGMPSQADEKTATTTKAVMQGTSASLTVDNQKAGSAVRVRAVTVASPGVWAVVHELHGTELANALGAARVRDTASDVLIPLLRGTVAGATYAVALYRDNGNEVFDLHGDSAYVDFASGEKVVASFKAE